MKKLEKIDVSRLNDSTYVLEIILNLTQMMVDSETKLEMAISYLKILYKPGEHSESIGAFLDMIDKGEL